MEYGNGRVLSRLRSFNKERNRFLSFQDPSASFYKNKKTHLSPFLLFSVIKFQCQQPGADFIEPIDVFDLLCQFTRKTKDSINYFI